MMDFKTTVDLLNYNPEISIAFSGGTNCILVNEVYT